ncbi:MAG: hypothetical protein LBH95_05970 [Oscillospiraceae bacterium]|jgi:hypothetical protein|nr:hypothetical protein [Oscillospiraceae bacterium]
MDKPVLPGGRVTVLAGHYGSGKTSIAAWLALEKRKRHERVTLCDLDIVNPYFRAEDNRELLEGAGVRLISSAYAGSSVETPGFPPEAASVFDDPGAAAVIDVGGDDRGALALGRYELFRRLSGSGTPHGRGEADPEPDGIDILLVVNKFRPLSAGARDACEICRGIEAAGRFRFTGIVNNSNLGAETAARDVLDSLPYAAEIGESLALPVIAVSAARRLGDELRGRVENLWLMELYRKWVPL